MKRDDGGVSSDRGRDAVAAGAIAEPHIVCSESRMTPQPVMLCIQDITSLDFNGENTDSLGPRQYEAQLKLFEKDSTLLMSLLIHAYVIDIETDGKQ